MGLLVDEAARLRAVGDRFGAVVLATSDWDAPPPVAGWAARDVVEHLVSWLTGLLGAHGADLRDAPTDAGMEPMEPLLRASGQYGPRVPVPPDADPQTRLVAFIGRDPAWSPA